MLRYIFAAGCMDVLLLAVEIYRGQAVLRRFISLHETNSSSTVPRTEGIGYS